MRIMRQGGFFKRTERRKRIAVPFACLMMVALILTACAQTGGESDSGVSGANTVQNAFGIDASSAADDTEGNDMSNSSMTENGGASWLPVANGAGEPVQAKETGVVYEIFVGSFADSNDDGIGDLKGIEGKLDYIAALGASDIWLTPIHPSDSYHHYDVIDYLEISPQFGTMNDLKDLIQACHVRGMKLYLDLVINHSSNRHAWFEEGLQQYLTAKSGLNEAVLDDVNTGESTDASDANMSTGTAGSSSQSAEAETAGKDYAAYYNFTDQAIPGYAGLVDGVWYEAWFSERMPDLNLDNEEVCAEIKKITDFYLDLGIDGFRLDASLYYYNKDSDKNVAFLSWLNDVIKEKNPEAYIVSETWTSFSALQKYYGSGIDSFFAFDFSDSNGLFSSCIKTGKGRKMAERFAEENRQIKEITGGAGVDAIFLSNHDQGRSGGWFTKPELTKLAAAVYLLAPGKPFMYYGEEIGLRGSGIDQNKRMAMQWGEGTDCNSPDTCDYTAQIEDTVTSEAADETSLLNMYHDILEMRAAYPWLTYASAEALDLGDEALFSLIATESVKHIENHENETTQEASGKSTDNSTATDNTKSIHQIVIVHNFSAENKTFLSPVTGESMEIAGYESMIIKGSVTQ